MRKNRKGQPFDEGTNKAPPNGSAPPSDGWRQAVQLVEGYLAAPAKADELLAASAETMSSHARRRTQALFYGVIRWLALHEAVVAQHVKKRPRPKVEALLLVASEELRGALEKKSDESSPKKHHHAQIVDHAVGQARKMASKQEAGFINAVLRRIAETFAQGGIKFGKGASGLSVRYSHPEWLVERWLERFGREETEKLLNWNQQPAVVYFQLSRAARLLPEADMNALEALLEPSEFPGSYELAEGAGWQALEPYLQGGLLFAMDPAQQQPVAMLAPQAGARVLDLCAAPGGKSRMLLDALATRSKEQPQGLLVSLDLPGKRLERLQESIATHREGQIAAALQPPRIEIIGEDLLELSPERLGELKLPQAYDAILLDAPCSNTGVLRRRPDAKWRLSAEAIAEVAQLQEAMLHRALELLAPGGKLLYATCSVEAEENRKLIDSICAMREDVELIEAREYFPFESGHDGAGAFLLRIRA